MTAYRLVWSAAVLILVARGLVLGIGHAPVLTTLMFLLGAAAGVVWAAGPGGPRAGRAALVAGAVSAAVVGQAGALGAGLVLIVLVAAGSAPSVLSARGPWTLDALTRVFAPLVPGYEPSAPARSSSRSPSAPS